MIDTDKYEGHTPAPWEIMRSTLRDDASKDLDNWWVLLSEARAKTSGGEWMRHIGNSYMTEHDAKLVADAPLLLAEVKRLHEEITYIVNGIGQVASDAFSRMVIEDLRKVIE